MNDNLSKKLSLILQKDIFNGVYPVGTRIPSERDIALLHGVSRITVRDAVRELTQLGLLTKIPKSGTYVKDFRSEASVVLLLNIIRSTSHIDMDILESILDIRKVIEVHLTEKAASRIDEAGIAKLEILVETLRKDSAEPSAKSRADTELHELIFSYAGDIISRLVFSSIKELYVYYVDYFYTLPESRSIIKHYQSLLKAVKRRDSISAAKAMGKALIYAETHVMKALKPDRKGKTLDISKMINS